MLCRVFRLCTSSCPILLVTGQYSIFNHTTRLFHQAIMKTCVDKAKIEFIEVSNVANVLEEKVNFGHNFRVSMMSSMLEVV